MKTFINNQITNSRLEQNKVDILGKCNYRIDGDCKIFANFITWIISN